ncbi:MAG: class I SAM-dependent methyltransferase [Pseudomonadota bacterium]
MSFPYHDRFWAPLADFLQKHVRPDDKVLGSDLFWWLFPRLFRYADMRRNPEAHYDWIVIHKGELDQLPVRRLTGLFNTMRVAFANEVFVVLTANTSVEQVDRAADHVRALELQLAALRDAPEAIRLDEPEPVLPDEGSIVQFGSLDAAGLREAMNSFWTNGGYVYGTKRDIVYYNEIDRHIADMTGASGGRKVLDLCCGTGRLRNLLPGDDIVGVDLSDVAIEMAQQRHAGLANFSFRQMDARQLDFPDASFDLVLFVDAVEHVLDVHATLAEASRVLRPGGLMMMTVANRDSLNQFITRKLGYPEFVTNYQHVKEFSYRETLDLLLHARMEVVRTAGIFLFPYWGVPGIDGVVREITDDDAETVELMRVLGERAGAEYAYASVILARKT